MCPLSALQAPLTQIAQEVEAQRAQGALLIQVNRQDEQGQSTCIAQGYETVQQVTAEEPPSRQERCLLV